jgi:hypothetical protein
MGNRGILHNEANEIVKPRAHKAWVTCLLEFKGIKRSRPFSPGTYSELFFIDEATAFAAGHRPCAYCQRSRHLEFKDAWLRANVEPEHRASTSMPDIDKVLHAERAISRGGKGTYDAVLAELPQGAIFEHEEVAYLVSGSGCLPWSFTGYGALKSLDPATVVKVLTPRSIVSAFAGGFTPAVHQSVGA